MAIIGTTVKIQSVFTGLAGTPIDLDSAPELVVYDQDKNIVSGPYTCTKSDVGTYYINYVVPSGEGILYLELSGEVDGEPVVSRQELTREYDDNDGEYKLDVAGVISSVDSIKPNAYSTEQKTVWISELDGKIALEIQGLQEYTPGAKLVTPRPYSRVYELYAIAQINLHDGDYDSFANSMVMFNSALDDYAKHYQRTKTPAKQAGFINVWG